MNKVGLICHTLNTVHPIRTITPTPQQQLSQAMGKGRSKGAAKGIMVPITPPPPQQENIKKGNKIIYQFVLHLEIKSLLILHENSTTSDCA